MGEKKRKKSAIGTIVIISFLTVLAFAAMIFAVASLNLTATATMELPLAKSSCVSSSDGKAHEISATFTLTGNKGKMGKIGTYTIYQDVKLALSNLDFSKIPEDNSDEFVKDYVQSYLNSKYEGINISDIYVTSFATDAATMIPGEYEPTPEEIQRDNRQDILDAITNWNAPTESADSLK